MDPPSPQNPGQDRAIRAASSGTSSSVQPIGFPQTLTKIARTWTPRRQPSTLSGLRLRVPPANHPLSQALGSESPHPPGPTALVPRSSRRGQLRAIRVRSSWLTGHQFPRPATGPRPISSPSSDARDLPKAAIAPAARRPPRTARPANLQTLPAAGRPGHATSTSPTSPLGADPDPGPRLRPRGANKLGVVKMRPSSEKCLSGRSAKKWRACRQGAPNRMV
jgi:hypothetical protein